MHRNGRPLAAATPRTVASVQCATSTMIPSRSIRRTAAAPNAVSPPCTGAAVWMSPVSLST